MISKAKKDSSSDEELNIIIPKNQENNQSKEKNNDPEEEEEEESIDETIPLEEDYDDEILDTCNLDLNNKLNFIKIQEKMIDDSICEMDDYDDINIKNITDKQIDKIINKETANQMNDEEIIDYLLKNDVEDYFAQPKETVNKKKVKKSKPLKEIKEENIDNDKGKINSGIINNSNSINNVNNLNSINNLGSINSINNNDKGNFNICNLYDNKNIDIKNLNQLSSYVNANNAYSFKPLKSNNENNIIANQKKKSNAEKAKLRKLQMAVTNKNIRDKLENYLIKKNKKLEIIQEKINEEINKELTFAPNIYSTNKKNKLRTFQTFIESQQDHIQRVQEKINFLKQNQAYEELSNRKNIPTIDRNSRKMVNLNQDKNQNVYDRLYNAKNKQNLLGNNGNLNKSLTKVQIDENKKYINNLYLDGQRREERMKNKEKEMNEEMYSNRAKSLNSSNKILYEKFRVQFQNEINNLVYDDSNCINYKDYVTFLKNINFITPNLQQKEMQLMNIIFDCLSQPNPATNTSTSFLSSRTSIISDKSVICIDHLFIFCLSILGLLNYYILSTYPLNVSTISSKQGTNPSSKRKEVDLDTTLTQINNELLPKISTYKKYGGFDDNKNFIITPNQAKIICIDFNVLGQNWKKGLMSNHSTLNDFNNCSNIKTGFNNHSVNNSCSTLSCGFINNKYNSNTNYNSNNISSFINSNNISKVSMCDPFNNMNLNITTPNTNNNVLGYNNRSFRTSQLPSNTVQNNMEINPFKTKTNLKNKRSNSLSGRSLRVNVEGNLFTHINQSMKRKKEIEKTINEDKQNKAAMEMQNCTFKPTLNKNRLNIYSEDIVSLSTLKNKKNDNPSSLQFQRGTTNNLNRVDKDKNEIEYEKNSKECTFQPKINKNWNKNLASSKYTNDYTIEEQEKYLERYKNSRIEREILKSKLALREGYEYNNYYEYDDIGRDRLVRNKSAGKIRYNTDNILRSGSKGKVGGINKGKGEGGNNGSYSNNAMKSKGNADNKKLIISIDVGIKKGIKKKLYVYEGDKPDELAKKFSTENQLDAKKQTKLNQLIKKEIDNYYTNNK